MKRRFVIVLVAVITLAAGLALSAQADSADDVRLWWHLIASGGGESSGGGFVVKGSIGQPGVAVLTGGSFTLRGGFWPAFAGGRPAVLHRAYLPVVLKRH
jgi:hypothetical protein